MCKSIDSILFSQINVRNFDSFNEEQESMLAQIKHVMGFAIYYIASLLYQSQSLLQMLCNEFCSNLE